MGVYAGKDPTRASVEVQRTQEKDISRNFPLPQKQCSCLPSSHDLLENPSPSKSKHIPEDRQHGSREGLAFSISVLTGPVPGEGKERGRFHICNPG